MKIVKRYIANTKIFNIYLKFKKIFDFSIINILKEFSLFSPASAGNYKSKAMLTIDNINSHLDSFYSLIQEKTFDESLVEQFSNYRESKTDSTSALKEAYDKFGSDKSSIHDYHMIYSIILSDLKLDYYIFEIGLGSNNKDVVSNMGSGGFPGASLRAFKDVFQKANVYGADVDKRILFNEDRIKTFYIDQTDVDTFIKLDKEFNHKFDLMIDDGLHSLSANLNSLYFFTRHLKVNGFIVIEDIPDNMIKYWLITSKILSGNFVSTTLKTKSANIFIAKRIS